MRIVNFEDLFDEFDKLFWYFVPLLREDNKWFSSTIILLSNCLTLWNIVGHCEILLDIVKNCWKLWKLLDLVKNCPTICWTLRKNYLTLWKIVGQGILLVEQSFVWKLHNVWKRLADVLETQTNSIVFLTICCHPIWMVFWTKKKQTMFCVSRKISIYSEDFTEPGIWKSFNART